MFVSVSVSAPPKRRAWDGDLAVKLDPRLWDIPGLVTVKTIVDAAKLEGLIKLQIVDESLVAPALTVTEGTPAVTIRIKRAEVGKCLA